MKTKQDRFFIFLERLKTADSVSDHDAALELIRNVLNRTEDEFTDILYNPNNHVSDGRMYPPQDDSRRNVKDRPDLIRYRSKGHNTYISSNGAILITDIKGNVHFCKTGTDGKKITL